MLRNDSDDNDVDDVQVATYQQTYDSVLLDAGGPAAAPAGAAAAGDDDLESVNLLHGDSHPAHRLSFGSVTTYMSGIVISYVCHVHRCFNGTAPRYLARKLQRIADTASRRCLRLASSPALHVPQSLHKTIGDRAFHVAAAKVWNKLPPAVTSLSSLHTFKRALKTELFRRSYDDAHHRPQQL